MNQNIALRDILGIEDSPQIPEIRCTDTGIPLWTAIRVAYLRLVIGDMLYGVPLVNKGSRLREGARSRQVMVIAKSFTHNALRLRSLAQQYPVVVMATGARLEVRGGRYFNCLSDHFTFAAANKTLGVEDLFGWKWPFPRICNNILIQTPFLIEGALNGRLRASRYRESSRALVDLVSQRARALLDWNIGEERFQWLSENCAVGAASFLSRYRRYQSLFKKVGARLLIKEEACYGGAENAGAIIAAKHLGIVVAEYQHGAVSSGHDAYNYAPAIANDPSYRQILPDHFLAFGSWWGAQINAPVEKLSVGNPHRTETLAVPSQAKSQGCQILVLGDGIDTILYLQLCEGLAAALGDAHKVVFRPHPLERVSLWAKYPNGLIGTVSLDTHQDMYSAFREAAAVISEVSTGLFEAIGLVPKIFIWDTAKARFSYPMHPFQRFSDVADLARLVLDESAGQVSATQIDRIWAPHWKKNYLAYIEQAIPQ